MQLYADNLAVKNICIQFHLIGSLQPRITMHGTKYIYIYKERDRTMLQPTCNRDWLKYGQLEFDSRKDTALRP